MKFLRPRSKTTATLIVPPTTLSFFVGRLPRIFWWSSIILSASPISYAALTPCQCRSSWSAPFPPVWCASIRCNPTVLHVSLNHRISDHKRLSFHFIWFSTENLWRNARGLFTFWEGKAERGSARLLEECGPWCNKRPFLFLDISR